MRFLSIPSPAHCGHGQNVSEILGKIPLKVRRRKIPVVSDLCVTAKMDKKVGEVGLAFLLLYEMSSCQHHPLLLNSRDVSRCAHQLLLQARKNSRADTLRQYRLTQPLPPPLHHSITSGYLHFCVIPPLVRAWGHRPHPSPALMSFDGVIRMLQCWFFFSFYCHTFPNPGESPPDPSLLNQSSVSPPVRH